MTTKRGPLNDSASSYILRSPCRDVVAKAIQPSTKSSGFVRPEPPDGSTVCLRGTRSLKTEQDEEADLSASLRRHGDRWTPVRLAHPSGCVRFNELPRRVVLSLLKHGRPSGRPQRTTRQTEAMARFGI
jgi:hypothetical protein